MGWRGFPSHEARSRSARAEREAARADGSCAAAHGDVRGRIDVKKTRRNRHGDSPSISRNRVRRTGGGQYRRAPSMPVIAGRQPDICIQYVDTHRIAAPIASPGPLRRHVHVRRRGTLDSLPARRNGDGALREHVALAPPPPPPPPLRSAIPDRSSRPSNDGLLSTSPMCILSTHQMDLAFTLLVTQREPNHNNDSFPSVTCG